MSGFQARRIAFELGLEGQQVGSAVKLMMGMFEAFQDLDANMIEINPLVVTGSGDIMAIDAKMDFDDNDLFRHPYVEEMRDVSE
jgi:succinyl-CoA synthetase beta subunit